MHARATFDLPSKDGLVYVVTGAGEPANDSANARACYLMVRTVWVQVAGEPLSGFTFATKLPGYHLVSCVSNNFAFAVIDLMTLLTINSRNQCRLKKHDASADNDHGVSLKAEQLLPCIGKPNALAELFEQLHKSNRFKGTLIPAHDYDSPLWYGYGSDVIRIRQGVYTLILDGPPAVGADCFTHPASLPAIAIAFPDHVVKIERFQKKKKNVVSVPAKDLMTTERKLRSYHDVFVEAYERRIGARDQFQPNDVPWRICFQLEAPTDKPSSRENRDCNQSDWQIRILFQSIKDPSLLVPSLRETTGDWNAAKYFDVLEVASLRFPLLKRWVTGAKAYRDKLEYIRLKEPWLLPRATKHLPPSHDTLILNFSDVLAFLETECQELERAGFGIRLPSWMCERGSARRVSLVPRIFDLTGQESSQLTAANVTRVNWEVCLGEDQLSVQEIEHIAQLKVPLVKMRGKWAYVTADEIQAIARLLRDGCITNLTPQEIVRLAIDGKTPYDLSPFIEN